MDQSICNGHNMRRPTNTGESKEGAGGTIITPQDTLAQFAVIDSTTAVWAILSAVIRHMIRASHCILKTFNQFIGQYNSHLS